MENQWKTNGKPMENQCTCIHLDRLKAGDPGRAKNPRTNQGNILETDGESSHENLCSNKESPPYKTNIGSIGSHFKIQIPNKNNCGWLDIRKQHGKKHTWYHKVAKRLDRHAVGWTRVNRINCKRVGMPRNQRRLYSGKRRKCKPGERLPTWPKLGYRTKTVESLGFLAQDSWWFWMLIPQIIQIFPCPDQIT